MIYVPISENVPSTSAPKKLVFMQKLTNIWQHTKNLFVKKRTINNVEKFTSLKKRRKSRKSTSRGKRHVLNKSKVIYRIKKFPLLPTITEDD